MPRLLAMLLLAMFSSLALAQAVKPPPMTARSWLLLDVTTGKVLVEHEADRKADPASLTKLMTAYLAFNALREKRISLEDRPMVSQKAFRAIGSRMFVEPARPATVAELLRGMIIQSGNDASIVLAELLAGSEESFVELMNREALRLGMTQTQFRNSNGLPHPEHHSTARDLSMLASRLVIDHPDFYRLYSEREFTYNKIRQPNRNRLLGLDPTVDGMKTGYTEAAGYCLVASAQREQPGGGFARRLLSVVMGAASDNVRVTETQRLLNYGFQNFEAVRAYSAGQQLGEFTVWKGRADKVSGVIDTPVFVTVARGQGGNVKGDIERIEPLVAPVREGQRIGTLRIRLGEQLLAERPVLAQATVDEAGFMGRLWDSLRMTFSR
jgi:D-alanyl-D-alanine carboxypeptidase (penicillin-binding protein 5/6)